MVRQRIATTISIIMLAFILGLQWVMLQAFAWVSMTISYTGEASVYTAIIKALDSKTTCVLCRVVDAGKKSVKDDPDIVIAYELEGLTPGLHPMVLRPNTPCLTDGPSTTFHAWPNEPLTPPPQSSV